MKEALSTRIRIRKQDSLQKGKTPPQKGSLYGYFYTHVSVRISKVGDLNWGWPEGSFSNSYYTEV